MRTREQLAARQEELKVSMNAIVTANPVMVPKEEQDKFDAYLAEINQIKAEEIELNKAEQRAVENRASMASITPVAARRQADSQDVFQQATQNSTAGQGGAVRVISEVMNLDEIRTRFADCPERKPMVLNSKNGGFQTMGEQLVHIAVHGKTQGAVSDPRLYWENVDAQMAITGAGASVPSDGGFLIQKDVATNFESRLISEGEVLKGVDTVDITSNSDGLAVNMIDETSRADGSQWGGVQAFWGAEADTASAKKPKFRQAKLILKDLIGLAYVTDRLLMDASALGQIYEKAFGEVFTFKMEDGVFNGTGGGQMEGFLNSPCLVKATRTTSGTIKYEDIVNMWSRVYARSRKNAGWFINQDIEPALYTMSLAVGTAGAPVYLPAGGASGQPYATLYGRPVIATEYNASLGTVGDIVCVDLDQYAMIKKGGVRSDSSIHVRFIYNESTFRWLYRTDGQPKWALPLTPAKGSATKSPFVALAT